jgi:hypothetical protein
MELDGWLVGSRVYLEKWACPGLGRAIPDLGATEATDAAISPGTWGDFWGHKGGLVVCPAVTESLRLLLPFQV